MLGRTDRGGRPDGVPAMVARGHAYVGHMFADDISVIDVGDPCAPKPVRCIACPPNTRASDIRVHDGLLLASNAANVWALQRYDAAGDYFAKPLADGFSKRPDNLLPGCGCSTWLTRPAEAAGASCVVAALCRRDAYAAAGPWAGNRRRRGDQQPLR